MRLAPLALLAILISPTSFWAQQATPTKTASAVPKDSQALSVLNQALTAAGGAPAIGAILDYKAMGNVTFGSALETQEAVTIQAEGSNSFRMDVTSAAGQRSQTIKNGKETVKTEGGTVSPLRYHQAPMNPGALLLPYWLLRSSLKSPQLAISYKGVVTIDGRSTHDIQVQRVNSVIPDSDGSYREYHTTEFFIDSSTLQVVMMQDVIPKHLVRRIRYSAFTSVSGVLIPFSISEEVNGQKNLLIQLSQISFNTGLVDSDFQLGKG